nr:MAG TPA: hypothetical protein [Caudoviricetes sp.]
MGIDILAAMQYHIIVARSYKHKHTKRSKQS